MPAFHNHLISKKVKPIISATQLYRNKMVELAHRFEDLTFCIADEDHMKVESIFWCYTIFNYFGVLPC